MRFFESIKTIMEKFSRGTFFLSLQTSFFLLCGGSHVQSSLLPEFALLFLLVSTMLGLRAWGDDLVAVLFEFLDDDTKPAQKNLPLHHITSSLCCLTCPLSRVSCLSVLVSVGVLPRLSDSDKKVSFFFPMASKSVDTR